MRDFFVFIAGVGVALGIGEVWPGGVPRWIPPPQPVCQFVNKDGRKFTAPVREDTWCYTTDLKEVR